MSRQKRKPVHQEQMFINSLDEIALEGLTDPAFVTERGMCQKFTRQCIQAKYGAKFDSFHEYDAKASAAKWKKSKYAVKPEDGSKIGDILYYTSRAHGPHGHVGIRVRGNKLAENSYVHDNGKHGGKGTRNLSDVGTPSLIVRLP